MLIRQSRVQFSPYLCKWLTKSHDCKAGVSFVNHDYDYQQKVLLPIDQNYDKTWETNYPSVYSMF